jgi:hypothetical protein
MIESTMKREWPLVIFLTAIMVLKGVVWTLAFPLWQGPDEDDHYAVIQFIGENSRLPDEADVYLPDEVALSRALADVGRLPYEPEQRQSFSHTAEGPNEAAFAALPAELRTSVEIKATGKLMHATPLYYMMAAVVYRLFDDGDLLARAHIQRLLVVILSSPLVIVAYLIGRTLFPTNAMMRLTIPTLVAFHPMISEITAVISVDGFFFVCYSLLIYLGILVFRDGFTRRYAVAIGVIFAVGVLIKPTLNGFAPLIGLLVAYDWWRDKERRREVVISAVLMAVIIALPVGWWMQRSWRLNGDLFYFNPVVEGHRILQNPFYDYRFWPHMVNYYKSVWGGIFVTWWAHFGWLDTAMPPWIYNLLRGLTVLAIGGLLVHLVRFRNRPPTTTAWQQGQSVAPLPIWGFLALTIILPVLLLQFYDLTFWWEYGVGRGLQGRYWLGTAVPMLAFFALGLLLWLPVRLRPLGHIALRTGMVLFNFAALWGYILPRYYL